MGTYVVLHACLKCFSGGKKCFYIVIFYIPASKAALGANFNIQVNIEQGEITAALGPLCYFVGFIILSQCACSATVCSVSVSSRSV